MWSVKMLCRSYYYYNLNYIIQKYDSSDLYWSVLVWILLPVVWQTRARRFEVFFWSKRYLVHNYYIMTERYETFNYVTWLTYVIFLFTNKWQFIEVVFRLLSLEGMNIILWIRFFRLEVSFKIFSVNWSKNTLLECPVGKIIVTVTQ